MRAAVSALVCATLVAACSGVSDAVFGPFLVEPAGGGVEQSVDTVSNASGTVWVGYTNGELRAGDTVTGTLSVDGDAGASIALRVPAGESRVTSGDVSFDPPDGGWAPGSYRVELARNATAWGRVAFTVAP